MFQYFLGGCTGVKQIKEEKRGQAVNQNLLESRLFEQCVCVN